MKVTPNDFGVHHRLSNSGLVQASNTMRAGALKVRVTTSSRSDVRSTAVRLFPEEVLLASISHFLLFQFLNKLVQFIEACGQKLGVALDPCRLFLQPAQAKLAGPHAPDLPGGDEPGPFQDA